MSKRKQPVTHPSEEELLRLSDGELPAREAMVTRSHLEQCWECRSRLDELEAGIADYMRYERNVRIPLLPRPPRPWADLRQCLEEPDSTTALRRTPRVPWVPPAWLAVAAAILLVVLIVWRFDRVPQVSAAELLRKAAMAESSRPAAKRPIQIRTRHRNYIRTSSRVAGPESSPELRKLFEEARYSWDNPLSVEAYRAWHDRLPERQDSVKSTGSAYIIQTSTTASVLSDATLTLRSADLQAVQGRLQFRSGEWVEISEGQDEPVAPQGATAKAHEEAPPVPERPATITQPAIPQPAAAGPSQELQIAMALHRIGADLGEPVEVSRDGSKLVVAAMGLRPGRQAELHAAIANIPGAEVRFDQPELMSSHPGIPIQQRRKPSGEVSALQLQIQNQLGDAGSVEEFTNRVLDASEAALARAYALRGLARRFTPDVEAQLNPQELSVLVGLRRDHLNALMLRAREINQLLQPALADLTTSTEAPPSSAPSSQWQSQVQQLFGAMQRVDRLLTAMLAGAESGPAGQNPGELASALALLDAELSRSK